MIIAKIDLKGCWDATEIIGNTVLVNTRFHTQNNFSGNYPQFEKAPSKMLASPVLGRKWIMDIGKKGRRIISLTGAPTNLGSTLILCVFMGSWNQPWRILKRKARILLEPSI